MLRDEGSLPALPELAAFADEVDAALAALADALREQTMPQVRSPRPAERRLAEALAANHALAGSSTGIALADTCDRIADIVDTLAHLLRQARKPGPDAPPRPAG